MANNWNTQFLNQLSFSLNGISRDNSQWPKLELKEWSTQLLDNSDLIDELTRKFVNFTILNKSFSEIKSPWIMFAGNNRTSGFLIIVDKNFSKYEIIEDYQLPDEDKGATKVIQFPMIEDFVNDLYGQIFILNKTDNVAQIFHFSNPYVSEEIEDKNILLIKKLKFNDKKLLNWEDDKAPSDDDWNSFYKGNNLLLTYDISQTSPTETISILSLKSEKYNDILSKETIYVLNYAVWNEKSTFIKSKQNYYYMEISPKADIKQYEDYFYFTINFNQPLNLDEHKLKGSEGYVKYVTGNFTNQKEIANPIVIVSQFNHNTFDEFEYLKSQPYWSWVKAYYDWLKSFNGQELISATKDLSIYMCTELAVGLGAQDNPDYCPYVNNTKVPRYFLQDWNDSGGDWGWFKLELRKNWLTSNNIMNVNTTFKRSDGKSWQSQDGANTIILFLVNDFENSVEERDAVDSRLKGKTQWITNLDNWKMENEMTQTLIFKQDLTIYSSTFTIKTDGTIDITTSNTIDSVNYSVDFFNIPAIKNKNNISLAYKDNNGYGVINDTTFHLDNNDKVVIDKKDIINSSEKIDKIYLYKVKDDVCFETIKNNQITSIGNIYTKDSKKTINKHLAKYLDDYRLTTFFKDDNAIEFRVLGKETSNSKYSVVGASLPYNESEENSTFYRKYKVENEIWHSQYMFDLKRIALLYKDFSISDNNVLQLNYDKVSAYTTLKQESITYGETDKIQLINNSNIPILTSDKKILKDNNEIKTIGFDINLSTITTTDKIEINNNHLKYCPNWNKFYVDKLWWGPNSYVKISGDTNLLKWLQPNSDGSFVFHFNILKEDDSFGLSFGQSHFTGGK